MSGFELTVNGEVMELDGATTVESLVSLVSPTPKGVAVAINREIVPKSLWRETLVTEGSVIEIVAAAAGG
jgi:sulfur carrier protein